jgi:hypothetical protein
MQLLTPPARPSLAAGQNRGVDVTDKLVVAETGENGAVQAVWLWQPGMRGPRPIETREILHRHLADAEVAGASRDALMRWRPHAGLSGQPATG